MKRTEDEFIENFIEQMRFLKKSCDEYDKGDESEVKRISVCLRNLLKDKNRDISALSHLKMKESLKFRDSSTKNGGMSNYIFDRLENSIVLVMDIYMGLVIKKVTSTEEVPKYKFEPLFFQPDWQQNVLLNFNNWYEQVIYKDPVGSSLTRERLILSIAEQDGGNHFDLKVNNKYYQFKQNDSLQLYVNGQIVEFENNPAFTSLRQIAHEFCETIYESELAKYL
tara:strand:- start:16925 stop:17596 length:672 start_codon:yes stop_codon:yes gene_type:complete